MPFTTCRSLYPRSYTTSRAKQMPIPCRRAATLYRDYIHPLPHHGHITAEDKIISARSSCLASLDGRSTCCRQVKHVRLETPSINRLVRPQRSGNGSPSFSSSIHSHLCESYSLQTCHIEQMNSPANPSSRSRTLSASSQMGHSDCSGRASTPVLTIEAS